MELFVAFALALTVAADPVPAGVAAPPAARLSAMRALADGVAPTIAGPGESRRVERRAEPIYRFNDPAREFSDGTVWAWGRAGRPAALLTVAPEHLGSEGWRWLGELTSLAPAPLASEVPGGRSWSPSTAGVEPRPIPRAPAPAGDGPKRLAQMRELARRFKAHEVFARTAADRPGRYELRLLPRPILRYDDPASGLIDGALFFFVFGNNPEVAVLIEARSEGGASPSWSYGLARIAGAELHVELDGASVWERAKRFNAASDEPYWVFTSPIRGEDADD